MFLLRTNKTALLVKSTLDNSTPEPTKVSVEVEHDIVYSDTKSLYLNDTIIDGKVGIYLDEDTRVDIRTNMQSYTLIIDSIEYEILKLNNSIAISFDYCILFVRRIRTNE